MKGCGKALYEIYYDYGQIGGVDKVERNMISCAVERHLRNGAKEIRIKRKTCSRKKVYLKTQ